VHVSNPKSSFFPGKFPLGIPFPLIPGKPGLCYHGVCCGVFISGIVRTGSGVGLWAYEHVSMFVFCWFIHRALYFMSEWCVIIKSPHDLLSLFETCDWMCVLVIVSHQRQISFKALASLLLGLTCARWRVQTASKHDLISVRPAPTPSRDVTNFPRFTA
jgi:hypothetical protein